MNEIISILNSKSMGMLLTTSIFLLAWHILKLYIRLAEVEAILKICPHGKKNNE